MLLPFEKFEQKLSGKNKAIGAGAALLFASPVLDPTILTIMLVILGDYYVKRIIF
jgi:hypothetical protein